MTYLEIKYKRNNPHYCSLILLSFLHFLFPQSSTGSVRKAVENVIESVGHYPNGGSADISLQCAQVCRSSPAPSSSHVSIIHATPPLPTRHHTGRRLRNSPRQNEAVPSRTISTQTGMSIQRDFLYVNTWLEHCRVSTF